MSADNDLSKEQMKQLAAVFRAEALEHVKSLAEILFSLEEDTSDVPGKLSIAFRDAHSLKGSAGTLGFERVATMTHRFEDVLGAIRDGKASFDEKALDNLLQTLELIRNAVVSSMPGESKFTEDENKALQALQTMLAEEPTPGPTRTRSSIPATPSSHPPSPTEANAETGRRKEFIRVAEDRIDDVIARFGELFETGIQLESIGYSLDRDSREADRLSSSISSLLQKLDGTEHEAEAIELFEDHAAHDSNRVDFEEAFPGVEVVDA